MEEDAILVTREQYLEMLIDASFRDASEMEAGFMSWCERHVPSWRVRANASTPARFAIVGTRATSANAIRCAFCSTRQISWSMRSFAAGAACQFRAPKAFSASSRMKHGWCAI